MYFWMAFISLFFLFFTQKWGYWGIKSSLAYRHLAAKRMVSGFVCPGFYYRGGKATKTIAFGTSERSRTKGVPSVVQRRDESE